MGHCGRFRWGIINSIPLKRKESKCKVHNAVHSHDDEEEDDDVGALPSSPGGPYSRLLPHSTARLSRFWNPRKRPATSSFHFDLISEARGCGRMRAAAEGGACTSVGVSTRRTLRACKLHVLNKKDTFSASNWIKFNRKQSTHSFMCCSVLKPTKNREF